ncbi:MAG: CopG family transcriptional regulator [Chlamydiae bacterium]|nr:CopG family transcriptional regulator [Chlamydiota bacterium]MBI3265549.1 CopG family transcriptional regulator [Chlamydiota bacterium]
MNTTLTIRIPSRLRRELKEMSKLEHVPMSELVRVSLANFVSLRKFRKLRQQVLPFAEAQGLLSDEDVFRVLS